MKHQMLSRLFSGKRSYCVI